MIYIYGLSVYFAVCISVSTSKLELLTNFEITTRAKTQGMAVTDIDQDGIYEVVIAVTDGPNIILQYSQERKAYIDIGVDREDLLPIRDPNGQTVSVYACDVDGDGSEEIFILNENSVLETSTQTNRLIKHTEGMFVDVLSYPDNADLAIQYSGGFVTCIDHDGDGTYAILLGTYMEDGSGLYKLYAADSSMEKLVIQDISKAVGLNMVKDGTSVLIGPIVSESGLSDIFVTNSNDLYITSNTFRHNNTKVLYSNQGNGRFVDVTRKYVPQDDMFASRVATLTDINGDGTVDILTCSTYGPARKYLQESTNNIFKFGREDDFTKPSGCMNMLVADFDNNGRTDIFKDDAQNDNTNDNGIFEESAVTDGFDVSIFRKDIDNYLRISNIRGLTVADLNGDGSLELFVAHKESGGTTVSIYQEFSQISNNWLRIIPLTKQGAPARGSKVTLTLSHYRTMTSIVGGGCSRACQTEPFVHFGYANMTSYGVEVTWPDGHRIRKFLYAKDNRKTLQISYTGEVIHLNSSFVKDNNVSSGNQPKQKMVCVFLCIISCVYTFRLQRTPIIYLERIFIPQIS